MAVVRWLLRRGGLYVLIIVLLAIGPLVVQALAGGGLSDELTSAQDVSERFERLRGDALGVLEARAEQVEGASAEALAARLAQARTELAAVDEQLGRRPGWLASMRPSAILERKELELRQAVLQGEVRLLTQAQQREALRGRIGAVMAPTERSIAQAKEACDVARRDVRAFNARHALDRSVRNVLAGEAQRLTDKARRVCETHRMRELRRKAALADVERLKAELAVAQQALVDARAEARRGISRLDVDLSGTLRSLLVRAAVVLAGIIAAPYLIRLFLYFVLAPLAARRPAVRLRRPEGRGPAPIAPQPSATSVGITLAAGEELLVRQGFLQSTSSAGAKATRALLDWRHPFSSWASGLAFLTRIEGAGESTTVSAVNDPFAEVAVLALPEGAACVLQPRALVAVVQPIGRPVGVTSHWRLGSLHAWLTLQLRYLMFHGPARLVIKGGRGVRVERAERGRVFGQDQLVGFSPDLAYAITRTETFWPYFLGMEQLLKDRVEAGEGVLVLEEAPMAGGGRASRRRGLEGLVDVLLKAVGL